jgi:hypothetical protein
MPQNLSSERPNLALDLRECEPQAVAGPPRPAEEIFREQQTASRPAAAGTFVP